MLTWKYTLPAFLVPFVFTLSAEGRGVLLQAPAASVLTSTATAVLGVGALAAGLGGWIRRKTTTIERVCLVTAGLLLFYAQRWADGAGIAILAIVLALHVSRRARV